MNLLMIHSMNIQSMFDFFATFLDFVGFCEETDLRGGSRAVDGGFSLHSKQRSCGQNHPEQLAHLQRPVGIIVPARSQLSHETNENAQMPYG
jgi:hypothetical protein